jgi:DNA-binding transcriptional ArsR family regulator
MDGSSDRSISARDLRFLRNSSQCEEVLEMFSLFSNRFRFKILCLLNEDDFCGTEIVQLIGGTASNISQQLKILTLAGYLSKRREEKSIYYHLEDDRIKKLLGFLYDLYGKEEAPQR